MINVIIGSDNGRSVIEQKEKEGFTLLSKYNEKLKYY